MEVRASRVATGSSRGHGANARARVATRASAEPATPARPRGVVICPGLGNNAADYEGLADKLQNRGFAVSTAEVSRLDWSRNAAGLLDRNYWTGTLKPRPTVDWYLKKLHRAVEAMREQVDGGDITLLTHSAGGWLSRVYLLDFGTQDVDRLVSLGSPHRPPPKDQRGVVDQTRGILTWCEDACPACYHSEVEYVTVAGKFIQGRGLRGKGSFAQKVAGLGYQQVCGQAEVWGDGIVPLPAAHLEGAKNLDLDGVYHSPLGAADGDGGRPWYGSDGVLELWVHEVDGSSAEVVEEEAAVSG